LLQSPAATDVESLFDQRPARLSDPVTSQKAATKPQRGTQRHRLLWAYLCSPHGLTDEEAVDKAVIKGGWKRCSELRQAGWVETTGRYRMGSAGALQQVCEITDSGRWLLRELGDPRQ
jgi:hypothetical protein